MARLCLFTSLFLLHADYIMQNARLDESQAGIRLARRNINNVRYVDNTTLMAEGEVEWKNFFMRVKGESEKASLKLNIQKPKIMASSPITSWQIEGEKVEAVTDCDGDCSHEIKRRLLLGRKAMTNIKWKWSCSVMSDSLWPHRL